MNKPNEKGGKSSELTEKRVREIVREEIIKFERETIVEVYSKSLSSSVVGKQKKRE